MTGRASLALLLLGVFPEFVIAADQERPPTKVSFSQPAAAVRFPAMELGDGNFDSVVSKGLNRQNLRQCSPIVLLCSGAYLCPVTCVALPTFFPSDSGRHIRQILRSMVRSLPGNGGQC